MKCLAPVLLLLLLPLVQVHAEDVDTITEIRFVGNKVTREKVMLREMVIHVGDPVDRQRIERSRQAIMNLGLFKSVAASMEEGNVLVMTVEERFYILPLPLLDVRPDGEYGYGGDLRFDNLAGLNQHLTLTYEKKNTLGSGLPDSIERGLTYSYPRVSDTAYQLDFASKVKLYDFISTNPDLSKAHYHAESWGSSLGISRWANEGVSRGWRYGGGINHAIDNYQFIDGAPGDFVSGRAVSLFATLDYLNVDDHAFYRSGSAFGVRGEIGAPVLESDFSFSREQLYYRVYHHLPSNGANINSQWRFGFANGCANSCSAWSLGGASTLRGYASSYVSGNVYALANLEYHHPLSGFHQMRGVLFTDVGDAWADTESMTLSHLKTSVGVGLRWTVQSFVNLTLRSDFAYALDAQTYHAYFSTSASF